MILLRTERIVDVRHLRLRERIAERIVDLNFRQPQARRAVAIHDQIRLQPSGLQIGVHIGDFRHVLHGEAQLLGPGPQLGQIVPEQRVLVLRVGGAAAAVDVLNGLQDKSLRP